MKVQILAQIDLMTYYGIDENSKNTVIVKSNKPLDLSEKLKITTLEGLHHHGDHIELDLNITPHCQLGSRSYY